MVTIIKYKKSTIDHAIYIKLFYDGKASFLTVSTYDILSTTNKKTAFPELRMFLKKLLRLESKKDVSLST